VTALQLSRCITRVIKEAVTSQAPTGFNPLEQAGAISGGRAWNLLLAEDNPANQRVAMMLLAKMGYRVEVAGNGQLALAALAKGAFDAVLMDCQMPVMDGYETTRRIRAGAGGSNPKVPIIALTAYARTEDRARCLDAGMDDYVTKPIRAGELRLALERCGLSGGALIAPESGAVATIATEDSDPVIDERALAAARELPGMKAPSLLPELVAMYLKEEGPTLARLRELVAARRGELLADEAHSFGGSAATFGGMRVRRSALELERVVRVGDWPAALQAWAELERACERLRQEVGRRKLTSL
jgi:CheY-like chemotaxis protein/HPt (histidine-containing phosphotransfer) domain-containing protein